MPWPLEFYHYLTDRQKRLTDVETGDMDIDAVLNGNGNYIWLMSDSRIKRPKKLILTDWSTHNWSWDKTETMMTIFSRLLDDGFSLHFYQKEDTAEPTLHVFSQDNLWQLKQETIRENISLARHEDIIRMACISKRWSQDSVLLLDNGWVQRLYTNSSTPSVRQYHLSDCIRWLKDNPQRILADNGQLPEEFINDYWSTKPDSGVKKQLQRIKASFPAVPITPSCGHVRLDQPTSLADFLNGQPVFPNSDMTIEALSQVRRLEINEGEETADTLRTILHRATSLETLKLTSKNLNGLLDFPERLPGDNILLLKELSLHRYDMKNTGPGFFASMPQLTQLTLEWVKGMDNTILTCQSNLVNLEFLTLTQTSLSDKAWLKLLSSTPQLRELQLNHTYFAVYPLNPLPNLRRLSIKDTRSIEKTLPGLLVAMPNLSFLSVHELPCLPLSPGSLPALKQVNIGFCNLKALAVLLLVAPKCHLQGTCIVKHDGNKLSDEEIQALSRLDWSLIGLPAQTLLFLSQHIPNCTSLRFLNQSNIQLALNPGSLSALETLVIENSLRLKSPGYSANVDNLLAAAPNIRSLSGSLSSAWLFRHKLSLLEALCFTDRSKIIPASFSKLCASFPRLKHLNVQKHSLLKGVLRLEPGCLPALEEIVLPLWPVCPLGDLIAAAPQLRYIRAPKINLDAPSMEHLEIVLPMMQELISLKLAAPDSRERSGQSKSPNIQTDAGNYPYHLLTLMGQACPELKELSLQAIKFTHFKPLARGYLGSLKTLELVDMNLPLDIMLNMIQACSSLDKLTIREYSNIPESDIQTLREAFPGTNITFEVMKSTDQTNIQTPKEALPETNITFEMMKSLEELLSGMDFPFEMGENTDQAATSESQTVSDYLTNHTSSSSVTPPGAPKHRPDDFLNFRPSPKDKAFQFKEKHASLAQSMIINTFCQYLVLKNKHLEVIPELQDGICQPLSNLYLQTPRQEWLRFIQSAAAWNGKPDTLQPELEDDFERLWRFVDQYQLQDQTAPSVFVGAAALPALLARNSDEYLLSNPWHMIAVKRLENEWYVFDPNAPRGDMMTSLTGMLSTIERSLGSLICVTKTGFVFPARIPCANEFLRHGGLLTLSMAENGAELLAQIPPRHTFSDEALNGLLQRTTDGRPAWFVALQNPVTQAFAETLLDQFKNKYPDTWMSLLNKSREAMDPVPQTLVPRTPQTSAPRTPVLRPPQHTSGASSSSQAPVMDAHSLLSTLDLMDFSKALKTWSTPASRATKPQQYAMDCLRPDARRKRLIELNSSQDAQALRFALQGYARDTARPFIYIHSPDELVFAKSWTERLPDNSGIIHDGPAGAFHAFMTANYENQSPIIVINYEEFSSEDIIRLMPMVDKRQRIHDLPMPNKVWIIGLSNINHPNCFQDEEFANCFDLVETCPLNSEILAGALPVLPFVEPDDAAGPVCSVDLFNQPGNKKRLTGYWEMDGQQFMYQPSVLEGRDIKRLELRNAPWDDPDFSRFWLEACFHGRIQWQGGSWELPEGFGIIRRAGYDWKHLSQRIECLPLHFQASSSDASPLVVLNPRRVNHFIQRFHCDNDSRSLHRQDGYLAMAINGKLDVLLTSNLTEDDWGRLLHACPDNVTLRLRLAPGLRLPNYLAVPSISSDLQWLPWPNTHDDRLLSVSSTDMDTSMAQLRAEQDWLPINISECRISDIVSKLTSTHDPLSRRFYFQEIESVIKQQLHEGRRILLWGEFSDELQDALAPFLLEMQLGQSVTGQLALVHAHSDRPAFSWLPTRLHEVSAAEKRACLRGLSPAFSSQLEPLLMTESLACLQARCDYLNQHPDSHQGDENWQGLEQNPEPVPVPETLDPATSLAETERFMLQRTQAVDSMLQDSPMLVLTGLSGVGKTTFVQKHFSRGGHRLHRGDHAMEAWARDTGPCDDGYIVLFLDEILISKLKRSELEGLLQTPPVLHINNQLLPLTDRHRLVAATNPLSYGDERELPPFLKRHGKALYFSPMPTGMIYEVTIKPMLAESRLFDDAAAIGQEFLRVYQFLVSCSKEDVLISPREIEMMALMTKSWCQRYPQDAVTDVAGHYARTIARPLVPSAHRAEFDRRFGPRQLTQPDSDHYPMAASRKPVRALLDDLLHARELRQQGDNERQCYGGLNGLALEGEPEDVDINLILEALHASGFTEQQDRQAPPVADKIYYRMASSLSCSEKQELLLKALNEGAVVVPESINVSPMMEEFLNPLLMLETPDGGRPNRTGFLYLGIQNPFTRSGRRAPSNALARRMLQCPLGPLPELDMRDMLESKGVSPEHATAMISAWRNNRAFALRNQCKPVPVFQNVLDLADRFMASILAITPDPVVAESRIVPTQDLQQLKTDAIAQLESLYPWSPQLFGSRPSDQRMAVRAAIRAADSAGEIQLILLNQQRSLRDQGVTGHELETRYQCRF